MPRRAKYQVFISSTFADLHEQREAVVWKVLTARHIPVGMENFSAANERGWQTIRRVLDDTDFYVLIIAGKYGSVDATTGISWTQREYEYAVEKGIPVLAFIRKDSHITKDHTEESEEARQKLAIFIKTVRNKHLCKEWATAEELAGLVVDALRNEIDDRDSTQDERPGWFRGDQVPAPGVANELARLSAANEKRLIRVSDGLIQGARLHRAVDGSEQRAKREACRAAKMA